VNSRIGVAASQLAVLTVYLVLFLTGDAPSPETSIGFSTSEWIFLLLPPALFAVALLAGILALTRRAAPPRWDYVLVACCTVLVLAAFAVSLALIPLSMFGEMTDI
jgi:hypothetical protein